jgi:hypothetical protein
VDTYDRVVNLAVDNRICPEHGKVFYSSIAFGEFTRHQESRLSGFGFRFPDEVVALKKNEA